MHSSSCIEMSAPSSAWISTARSGVRSYIVPSMCERKRHAVLGRACATADSDITWKPPESVEDRTRPVHEFVQPAERRDPLRRPAAASGDRCWRARYRRPSASTSSNGIGLHRRLRADRHEGRRADRAMRRGELAAPGARRRLRSVCRRRLGHACRAMQQTGVAIGIETIAGRNRMRIGALHRLQPAERRHQHEQRRARQVEIGEHQVHGAEAIARRDEDRGLAGERLDRCRRPPPRFPASAARSSRPRRCARRALRAAFSASAVSAVSTAHSACILWSAVSSALTGRNVPGPDMQRHRVNADAFAASRAISSSVKCSPAVGAATEPSSRANRV